MAIRKTLLIVEEGDMLTKQISPVLKERRYHTINVGSEGAVVHLIESNDRIYTIVLVCAGEVSVEQLVGRIKILKTISQHTPIIVTTDRNDVIKEKIIRKLGIYYYHIQTMGTDDLLTAVSSAMTMSVEQGHFIPSHEWQGV